MMETKPNLIHARCDRKMQPFYWILSFECFTLLIIFGLAMAGWSGYGARALGGWALLLLPLVAAGLWLAWKGYKLLDKFVWENTHLSSYHLFRDRLELIRYDKTNRSRTEQTVQLSEIVKASIAHHVAINHYAYKESKWRERQPLAHVLPSLCFVHNTSSGLRAVEIPFYEYQDMQPWLLHLQEQNVPLDVYMRMFNTTDEAGRAMVLTESEDVMPYSYDEALQHNHAYLLQQIQTFERREVPQ
ncbi:hypothetical protein [Paenibacillus daejeonensis]|uniref:hypothetical protein n=1 Tax=Paenibacillus daejeonensis TaxID=135193 RepID=UPI00036634D8|nr:hypothetical protein [Paenibacillus daejeonensis]